MIFEIGKNIFRKIADSKLVDKHAKFSPSNSYSWLDCAGYVTLKDVSYGKPASLGIKLHSKAFKSIKAILTLLERKIQVEDFNRCFRVYASSVNNYKDSLIKEGWDIDGVEDYYNFIIDELPINGVVYLEQLLEYNDVFFGTPDFVSIDHKAKTINIIDYKSGQYTVSPSYNPQLACYAILLKKDKHFKNSYWNYDIKFTIFQNGIANEFMASHKWLTAFEKDIYSFINAKNLSFNVTDNCHTCWRKSVCPAYHKSFSKDVLSFKEVSLNDLPAQDFIALYKKSLMVKKYVKQVENEFIKRAEEQKIPAHKEKLREVSIWKNKKEALKNDRFSVRSLIKLSEAKKLMTDYEKEKFISKRIDTVWRLDN